MRQTSSISRFQTEYYTHTYLSNKQTNKEHTEMLHISLNKKQTKNNSELNFGLRPFPPEIFKPKYELG